MQTQGNCLVTQQVSQFIEKYPYFSTIQEDDGSLALKGVLGFEGDFKGRIIQDEFDLELRIPSTYPSEIPIVKEIGFRIPRDFHINLDDSFCVHDQGGTAFNNAPVCTKFFLELGYDMGFASFRVREFI